MEEDRLSSVEIIAEIANAHQGDPVQAERLALAAVANGVDAVKFQVYFGDELLVRAHPSFEHFSRQAFSTETWNRLMPVVKAAGGRVYCDVFGLRALEVAETAGADGYKIHSSDLGNTPLLMAIAETRKPVMLAVGGSTAREISHAVESLGQACGKPILLHGFQSYPTAVEDSALGRLDWLNQLFGRHCVIGYSDHVAGDDPMARILPMMAVAMGARVIEKHITLDRAAKGIDYYSSIEPAGLPTFIDQIRLAEAAIGPHPEQFSRQEREYRDTVKKHWVTTRELRAGHLLTPADLVMKRIPAREQHVVDARRLLGRPLVADLPAETALRCDHVPATIWGMVVARMRSQRLGGKALADMGGTPALAHLLDRMKQCRKVDRVVLCTTTDPEDEPIAALGRSKGVQVHRGPVKDVLLRMLEPLDEGVDIILRATGDNILVDPEYVDRAIDHHLAVNAEYTDCKSLPSGTAVEVFDVPFLRQLRALSRDSSGTEYLTTYIVDNRDQIRVTSLPVPECHMKDFRLTIDTPEDAEVVRRFLCAMEVVGKGATYRMEDIVQWFEERPEILEINAEIRQRSTPVEVDTRIDWRLLVNRGAIG